MKPYIKKIQYIACVSAMCFAAACTFDEQLDPNNPSLSDVLKNASTDQLNSLTTGIQTGIREGVGITTTASGTLARELYLFDSDPRNITELITGPLARSAYYSTTTWTAAYSVIKTTNILIEALNNPKSY